LTYFYRVWHRDNPNGAVTLAFEGKASPMTVRDRACSEGHFQWREYLNLRVRKTKVQTPLKDYTEVTTKW